MLLRILALLMFAATLVFASPLPAQQPNVQELDAEAKAKFEAGDTQGALEIYRQLTESADGRTSWDVAANHGNMAFHLGLYAEAMDRFRYSLRTLSPSVADYELFKSKIEGRIAETRPKVGELTVTVEPAGAEVFIDGVSHGRAPLAESIFVMPGRREIQASGLAGYGAALRNVTIGAGERQEASLSLTPVHAGKAPTHGVLPKPDDDMSSARLGLGITGVALGIGGTVATIILGVTAADRAENVEELKASGRTLAPDAPQGYLCGAGSPALVGNACAQLEEQAREQLRFQGAAIATGVVGGLLLIGGIVILALPSTDASVELGVSVAPASSRLELNGRF